MLNHSTRKEHGGKPDYEVNYAVVEGVTQKNCEIKRHSRKDRQGRHQDIGNEKMTKCLAGNAPSFLFKNYGAATVNRTH